MPTRSAPIRRPNRSFLGLLSCTAIAATIAGPACAQTAPVAPSLDDETVKDIIVTAQKRPERLKDIPVATSVLSGDMIAAQHVTDLSDINRVVPSVEIKSTINGRVPYGMRGISTNALETTIGLTSGVSIQVDGVPVPADSFAANTVSDVAQLEVLKGPQATLGGRTASAGVINFVTNGPTDRTQGTFTAFQTSDRESRVEMAVGGPVTTGVLFSLSGFFTRVPYPVHNLTRGEQTQATDYGVRGKLKLEPTDDLDVTLTGHYALSQAQGENFVPKYLTPGAALFPFIPSEFNGPFGSPSFYGIRQAVAFPGYAIGFGNTDYASPVDTGSRYEDVDGSVAINYKLGGLTLSSLTSYFRENQRQRQESFITNVYFFNILTRGAAPAYFNDQTGSGFVRQVTQEFKVASDPSDPINFIGGAYYSDQTTNQFFVRPWISLANSKLNDIETRNYSLYGRVTAKLTDLFSVVGGLRYNHDLLDWTSQQFFDPTKSYYQGCGFNAALTPPPGAFPCTHSYRDRAGKLVGDVALQAHLDRDDMAYASYVRGYKPRAYNTGNDFSSLQSAPNTKDLAAASPVTEETIDSGEIGLKSTLFHRHVTFNADVFYTNYGNYQAQIFQFSGPIGTLVLANAGADTKGVEADVDLYQGGFHLSLSGAYIDARFKNFPNATCFPTQTAAQGAKFDAAGNCSQDLSGKSLPNSPKFKINGSVERRIPLAAFDLLLGTNVSYRTSTLFLADQNPQSLQPSFALVDLTVGAQTKDGAVSITAFADNLTNRFYYGNMEDFYSGGVGVGPAGPGFVPANYVIGQAARNSHRYVGARLSVKF